MALFDWIASLLGAVLLGIYVFRIHGIGMWIVYIIAWITFGVIVHLVMGVDTMFGYYLGLNPIPKRRNC